MVFQIALRSRERGMEEAEDEEHFIRTKKQRIRVALKIDNILAYIMGQKAF